MNLVKFIKAKGETINSLSKKNHIPYSTLHDGVHNPKQMRYENLLKISNYFNISMDYLSTLINGEKEVTLLSILTNQMESKLIGNIYHFTQINFAYNTNRIEGSKLTEEQTRMIFETNTIGETNNGINTDDLVETANTFYLFDEMLKTAGNYLTEDMIKRVHQILKNGTKDSRKDWFVVGGYKKLPNEVGGKKTTEPKHTDRDMKKLLNSYHQINKPTIEDIIDFHYQFESIHPFQDGNGRIGRLIMFKECLKNNITPFIIEESRKTFYYRGLSNYKEEKGYLKDTCLLMQDKYELIIKKYVHPIMDKNLKWNNGFG